MAIDRATANHYIQSMAPIIVERFRPERIILLGSQARGDARPDSDVDLLVVMDGDVDRRKLAIEIRRAVRQVPIPKDILVTTTTEIARRGHVTGTVLREALTEGRVLYTRS